MPDAIHDALGRELGLRTLSMLDRLRLYKALGPELALNEPYIGIAALAASAAMIDGVPVPFPTSESAVEHIVERLGETGLEAIAMAIAPPPPTSVTAHAGN
ncbi:MAG: hypothetical protein B7Z78_06330 [Rhodospirillales bacterium 20-60-12]|nr:MAG: hypothetical protein B7Z78_06330 [Rhodospirillales bacterium 20-60-12]